MDDGGGVGYIWIHGSVNLSLEAFYFTLLESFFSLLLTALQVLIMNENIARGILLWMARILYSGWGFSKIRRKLGA